MGDRVSHSVRPSSAGNDVEPVLELKSLSKSFGGLQAVRGVSLKIMPGDRKAIIGPNGAGKTTLIQCDYRHLSGHLGQRHAVWPRSDALAKPSA